MYKTVYDLNREQINELKDCIFWSALDEDEGILKGINYPWEIPDDAVFYHYSGICFTDDDF